MPNDFHADYHVLRSIAKLKSVERSLIAVGGKEEANQIDVLFSYSPISIADNLLPFEWLQTEPFNQLL